MTVSWGKALAVWWSAAWRGFLYGLVGGSVLGAIGGFIAAMVHHPDKAGLYGAVGGYLASIPVSMLALKQALSKHLASLAAIAASGSLAAQPGAPADGSRPAGSARG